MPPRLLLRLHRIGLIAMTYFGIFYVLVNSAAFPIIAGKTRASQEAFGHSVTVLGAQFSWLLPLPIRADTAAGYLQWRGYGFFAIVFAAWGLLSACGAVRRDEDRGLVGSRGCRRASRASASSPPGACSSRVLSAEIVFAGRRRRLVGMPDRGHAGGRSAGVVGESAALWGLTLACFGIGLLVAQLAADFRSAAAARERWCWCSCFCSTASGGRACQRSPFTDISVFFLFNQSNAVAPGGTFDLAATLLLFVVAAAATVVASVGIRPARHRCRADSHAFAARAATSTSASSQSAAAHPVARGLWIRRDRCARLDRRHGGGRCGGRAPRQHHRDVLRIDTEPEPVSARPPGRRAHRAARVDLAELRAGAGRHLRDHVVSRWSGDDSSGVLEMQLAEPVPRWRVLAERAAELTVTVTVMSFVAMAVILALAPAEGIPIDVGRLLAPPRCSSPSRSPSRRSERCSPAGGRARRWWCSRRSR